MIWPHPEPTVRSAMKVSSVFSRLVGHHRRIAGPTADRHGLLGSDTVPMGCAMASTMMPGSDLDVVRWSNSPLLP